MRRPVAHHTCPRCLGRRSARKAFCEDCLKELVRARNRLVRPGGRTADQFVDEFVAPYVTTEVADGFRAAYRDDA